MQHDNMESKETEPPVSASASVKEADTHDLVKNWPAVIGFDDAFTEDALLDEALGLLKRCADWIQNDYDARCLKAPDPDNPRDSGHPLAQALYFLRQFDDPSSWSENG